MQASDDSVDEGLLLPALSLAAAPTIASEGSFGSQQPDRPTCIGTVQMGTRRFGLQVWLAPFAVATVLVGWVLVFQH
jgi:hypothetical protein